MSPKNDQRRLPRVRLGITVLILRSDAVPVEARCLDASDEVFAIETDIAIEPGETVRLQLRRGGAAFLATVLWRKGSRVGLQCMASSEAVVTQTTESVNDGE